MKYIIKGTAPISLERYKVMDGARFDDMPKETKKEVKESLISDQGSICCYCGKRIHPDHKSIIEHLYPKGDARYKHLELEYSNLLCSCDGGESDRVGKSKKEKRQFPSFCDDKKNNRILNVTPLDPSCECQFTYDEEGHIYGQSTAAIEAIEILGLDCSPLVNLRKQAIDPYADLDLDEEGWKDEIEWLSQRHDDKFLPFCFAVTYYIKSFKLAL